MTQCHGSPYYLHKKIRSPKVLASCQKQVNTSRGKVYLHYTIPIYIPI